jgi:TonB family protein
MRARDYHRESATSHASLDVATPPKIIGRAPVPRFPDALVRSLRPEGEVVVRFKVNELGGVDVASMIAVESDHELFTAAVRDILPRFRFEPARTHAVASNPVAA